ncbi:MAG: reverse transcriptase domain-containing protein [Alphaproteobacteria bacterium]
MEQPDFLELLPDITLEELFKAYLDCRKHKRRSMSALRFERMYEHKLIQLHKDIARRTYRTLPSRAFIVDKPVQREVFAADFRDRIVHHLVIGQLIPLFEQIFSDSSYSCRMGKGTLFGIRSVAQMMKECSNYYTQNCYVLRLDIHGFFFHIDKNILYKKIIQLVNSRYFGANKSAILFMIQEILRDNPTRNCKISGSKKDWVGLPKTKSLFFSGRTKGLPIGNLTSQVFANFYMNDFDHFVTGLDKNIFYGRYVDDIVVIHPDHDYLLQVKQMIDTYLKEELGLMLHPKKISLQHYSKGFAFIGAYIKPGRIYPGKRLRASFYRKMQKLNEEWAQYPQKQNRRLLEKTLSSINSYFGLMKHFDAWRVKLKGWNMLDEKIRTIFKTNENLNKVWMDEKVKRQMVNEARQMFIKPLHPLKKGSLKRTP